MVPTLSCTLLEAETDGFLFKSTGAKLVEYFRCRRLVGRYVIKIRALEMAYTKRNIIIHLIYSHITEERALYSIIMCMLSAELPMRLAVKHGVEQGQDYTVIPCTFGENAK